MKKRSIYLICEHFEKAHNAVSGGYIYFEIACRRFLPITCPSRGVYENTVLRLFAPLFFYQSWRCQNPHSYLVWIQAHRYSDWNGTIEHTGLSVVRRESDPFCVYPAAQVRAQVRVNSSAWSFDLICSLFTPLYHDFLRWTGEVLPEFNFWGKRPHWIWRLQAISPLDLMNADFRCCHIFKIPAVLLFSPRYHYPI